MRSRFVIAIAIVVSLSLACSSSRPRPATQPLGASTDYTKSISTTAEACDGAEIFGSDSAFHCDRETCIRIAHDRSEAACSPTCESFFACLEPFFCAGEATFCQPPLVTEFKTARCPSGVGYHCVGACKCGCGCRQDA